MKSATDLAVRGFLALVVFAFVILLFQLVTGCATPLAGAPCPESDAAYCADAGVARSCQAGVLVDFPCPGPAGCKRTPDRTVMCDETSGAQPGTRCLPENEGHAQCAPDAASYLQCANGSWVRVACQQGMKCQSSGGIACK